MKSRLHLGVCGLVPRKINRHRGSFLVPALQMPHKLQLDEGRQVCPYFSQIFRYAKPGALTRATLSTRGIEVERGRAMAQWYSLRQKRHSKIESCSCVAYSSTTSIKSSIITSNVRASFCSAVTSSVAIAFFWLTGKLKEE